MRTAWLVPHMPSGAFYLDALGIVRSDARSNPFPIDIENIEVGCTAECVPVGTERLDCPSFQRARRVSLRIKEKFDKCPSERLFSGFDPRPMRRTP